MAATYPVSYSSVDDVYTVFPSMGSVTQITSAQISYQIGRVEAMINARLQDIYTIPFSSVPLTLTTIATDLTIYEMSKRFNVLHRLNESDDFESYKESEDLLESIVKGKTPLLDSSLSIIGRSNTSGDLPWSNTMDYTPTFNEKNFTNQERDEDKLDD